MNYEFEIRERAKMTDTTCTSKDLQYLLDIIDDLRLSKKNDKISFYGLELEICWAVFIYTNRNMTTGLGGRMCGYCTGRAYTHHIEGFSKNSGPYDGLFRYEEEDLGLFRNIVFMQERRKYDDSSASGPGQRCFGTRDKQISIFFTSKPTEKQVLVITNRANCFAKIVELREPLEITKIEVVHITNC